MALLRGTDHLRLVEVTIPAGLPPLSEAVDLRHWRLAGIRMPSEWVAADLAFLESPDNGVAYPFLPVIGPHLNAVDVTGGVSFRIDEAMLRPFRFIRLQSVGQGAGNTNPVDQGAPRTLGLLLIPG